MTITDIHFKRIMAPVGYPILALEDLAGDSISEAELQDLLIWPAMQEYYEVFPLKDTRVYPVGLQFDIPFPDADTFGVMNNKFLFDYAEGARTASPFMNSTLFTQSTTRKYGSNYHYDFDTVRMVENSYRKTSTEQNKTYKVNIDRANRKVTGYTNMGSKIEITWAKYSDNFDMIPFEDQTDVIKLAQSNVLQFFGDLRNQEAGSLPVDLNGSDMLSRARDLRQDVTDRWTNRPKGMILR